MNRGITQKQYLELVPPTEEDARSSQMRILDALKEKGITASFTLPALQKLYPICDEADYNITVSLAWNGSIWQAVDLEAGDTAAEHYGYAADLGSTTVVVRLVNCSDGTVLAEESEYNRQTAYGTDILTRIFACKDKPEVLQTSVRVRWRHLHCSLKNFAKRQDLRRRMFSQWSYPATQR